MGRIVVAVPAVLARPPASPVAQDRLAGTRSRDPRGGKWCRALGEPRAAPPSAAIRAGPRLPRRGGAPGASCCPTPATARNDRARRRGCSAGCPSSGAVAAPQARRAEMGAPGLAVHPHGFGQHPRQTPRSGPTQRTLWRSSITRFGGGTSVGPPSTKNGIRHPAVTARRSARCPGRACALGRVTARGCLPTPDPQPVNSADLPMSRLV